MARIIKFEGREISVPDDATDDEVASIIDGSQPDSKQASVVKPAAAARQSFADKAISDLSAGETEKSDKVRQLLEGIAGGAANIAVNVSRPLNVFNPFITREQFEQNVTPVKQFNKEREDQGLFQVGKIGSEIAGTAALPAGILKGATGFMPSAAQALGNIGAGAAAGGAAGYMTGGEEGMLSGAAVGAAIHPVMVGLAKGAGWAIDAVKGNLPGIHASKIARDALGKNADEIIAAWQKSPEGVTAAQAASGVDNDVLQALGKMVERHDPDAFYRLLNDKQKVAELNVLAKMARGSTTEKAAAARMAMKEKLEEALGPVREAQLHIAGVAGREIPEAEKQIGLAIGGRAINPSTGKPYIHPATGEPVYTGRAGAIQSAGKLYRDASQQRVEAAKTFDKNLGAIGDVKVQRHFNRFNEGMAAAQEFVDIAKDLSNQIVNSQKLIKGIDDAGLSPLDLSPVMSRIDAMLRSKSTRMSDTETKVLSALRDKLNIVGENGVDPHALYELRKKGMNEIVDNLSDTGVLSKESARASLLKLRPMIDNALEEAGATQWGKGYINKYQKGFAAIDRAEVMNGLRELYDTNPKKFIDVVKGNDPDFVKQFIPNKTGITGLFSENVTKKLTALSNKAQAEINMTERASGAATALTDKLSKDSWKVRFPMMLNRYVTAGNKALEIAEKSLDRKTMEALVDGMKSGKSAIEMINKLPMQDQVKIMRAMQESAKPSVAAGAIIGGQQQ